MTKGQLAAMIGARTQAKFPRASYGAMYVKRGTPLSLNEFGPSYRAANSVQRGQRRSFGYSGRGAYFGRTYGSMAGTALGSMAGGLMGGAAGAGAGGSLGSYLGGIAGNALENRAIDMAMNRVAAYRGRGSYVGNSLMGGQMMRPVSSATDETGDITITHREFVQAITPTSAGFQTQFFQQLNPGLTGFAPWLSQIAQYFEEYEMIQCVFEFKSLVTEGNSTAAGEVIMATQYNPMNSAFVSQANMENYDFAKSCKMTDTMAHGVECDPSKRGGSTTEYVRTGPVPIGQDGKSYDLAVTQLATVGAQPNLTIGNLYIYYKIRLSKAKVLSLGQQAALPILTASISLAGAPGQTVQAPFGTSINALTPFTGFSGAFDPTGQFFVSPVTGVAGNSNPLGIRVHFPSWVNNGVYRIALTFSNTTGNMSGGEGVIAVNSSSTVSRLGPIAGSSWILDTVNAYPTWLAVSQTSATGNVFVLDAIIVINSPQGTVASFSVGINSANTITVQSRLNITQMNINAPLSV